MPGEQAERAEKAEWRNERPDPLFRHSALSASCEPCRCCVHAVQSAAVVLDGELAVPCNPQPALAGLNSPLRSDPVGLLWRNGVEGWVPRVRSLRTRSGPEGSSRKKCLLSDVGVPGWSREPVISRRVADRFGGARPSLERKTGGVMPPVSSLPARVAALVPARLASSSPACQCSMRHELHRLVTAMLAGTATLAGRVKPRPYERHHVCALHNCSRYQTVTVRI